MELYALSAGILAAIVAVIHSVLGEKLVFSRMRSGGLVPTSGQPVLRERHVRILWATWHVVSIMGIAFGAILIHVATSSTNTPFLRFVLTTVVVTMVVCAVLVFYATKGRHPGWAGLLGVAVLTGLHLQTLS